MPEYPFLQRFATTPQRPTFRFRQALQQLQPPEGIEEEEKEKTKLSWWEYPFEPFTWLGESVYGTGQLLKSLATGDEAEKEKWLKRAKPSAEWAAKPWDIGEAFKPYMLGGEIRKEFQALPWWQQLLYELPGYAAMPAGVSGVGARAGLAGLAKKAPPLARQVIKGARGALLPLEMIEKAPAKLIQRIMPKRKLSPEYTAQSIMKLHNKTGGATVNSELGDLVGQSAYAVSAFPERTVKIAGKRINSKQIQAFIDANKDILSKRGVSIGTWFNPATGKTELDVVYALASKDQALAAAQRFGQTAIYDLKAGKTIYTAEQMGQPLIHYGKEAGLTKISPELMGSAQSGSELKFLTEYSPYFKEGWFTKRAYYYTSKQVVEPRFAGQPRYTTTEQLKIFDVSTVSAEELAQFDKAKVKLLSKFRKEFGENFGNLPQQAQEVEYAAAKSLGYDAFNTGKHVAVFKELPVTTGVTPVIPEATKFEPTPYKTIEELTAQGKNPTLLIKGKQNTRTMNAYLDAVAAKKSNETIAKLRGAWGQTEKSFRAAWRDAYEKEFGKSSFEPMIVQAQETGAKELATLIPKLKNITETTITMQQAARKPKIARLAKALETKEGVEAFDEATRALRGALPTAEFERLAAQLTPEKISLLNIALRTSKGFPKGFELERRNAWDSFIKLLVGEHLTRGDLGYLEAGFGRDVGRALYKARVGTAEKVWEMFMGIINIPKAMRASWDLSGLLRQGGVLAAARPKEALVSFKTMVRVFGSETAAKEVHNSILNDHYYKWIKAALGKEKAELFLGDMFSETVSWTAMEEAFITQLGRRLGGAPEILYKGLIRPSERAYVIGLNKLRFDVFRSTLVAWERSGVKLANPEGQRKIIDLIKYINIASGRGELGAAGRGGIGGLLNALLFSPKFIASRFQLPYHLFFGSPAVKAIAWRDFAAFMGVNMTLLEMLRLSGIATIEYDPRSADFGKIRIGNTRFDFWGGYQPYIRFFTQFITGERKTAMGRVQEVPDRLALMTRLAQTKGSPFVNMSLALLQGKKFFGEPIESPEDIALTVGENFIPLAVQDFFQAYQSGGWGETFPAMTGIVGASVLTYESSNAIVGEVYYTASQMQKIQEKARELYLKGDMTGLQRLAAENREVQLVWDAQQGEIFSETFRYLNQSARQLSQLREVRDAIDQNKDRWRKEGYSDEDIETAISDLERQMEQIGVKAMSDYDQFILQLKLGINPQQLPTRRRRNYQFKVNR